MNFKVLIFGSSGSIGLKIFEDLQKDDSISKIYCVLRKNIFKDLNNKVKLILTDDISNIELIKSEINEDIDFVFNTIGSRVSNGTETFIKIDKTSVLNSYILANKLNAKHFSHITSVGSNHKSWFLYLRTKGETEKELEKLCLTNKCFITIFRPGVILNRGKDFRIGELFLKYTPFFSKIERNDLAWNIIKYNNNINKVKRELKYKILENEDILNIK